MRLPIASGVATFAVALTLYPLFSGAAWFWGSLGAVLVVSAAGVLSSKLTLPGWAAPLVALAALGVYLTAVYTGTKAWGLLVPTRESVVALAQLLGKGFTDIQRFAAPVPANPGIALLTTGGVGLMAIIVDLFVTRMRRAALAGLPLLALFTVPAAVLTEPISWVAFILGALGFTSLLVADGRERVGHWGRAVLVRRTRTVAAGSTARELADTRTLRLSGKRIGFTAIVLAILLPAMLPTLEPNPLFGFGVGGNGKGGNGNSISIPNPIANLKGQLELPDNRIVLTYTNSDQAARYLRIYSLDVFDGEQWTMNTPLGRPADRVENGPLPAPPGLAATTKTVTATTKIQLSEDIENLNFLPLPYPPAQVQAEGDWRADLSSLMVFSTRDDAAGLEYQVVSTEPKPTADDLDAAPQRGSQAVDERYLKLPELTQEIRELALKETEGAKTQYEAAVMLQEFFTKTGGFKYRLTTSGHSTSALTDFLINGRYGYCEQFASAMAVLARVIGIPARVAIGYTGGTRVGGGWQVGTHDSHSWPELYFEGVGWLAFEPTPTGSLGQGSARVPDYSLPRPETSTNPATPNAGNDPESAAPLGPDGGRNPRELDREALLGGGAIVPVETTPLIAKIGMGAAVLLLVLLIPAGIRVVTRTRRHRALGRGPETSVDAVWTELDDVLCDYGMARQANESPRMLARRLTEQYEFGPGPAASITKISSSVERVLFARDPGAIEPLKKELREVRRALAATVSRGRRVRAALMPPSTLLRMRGMGERVLDGFDRLENIRFRRTAAQRNT